MIIRPAIVLAFLLGVPVPALAEPYVPAGDAVVLEQLPGRDTPDYRNLKRLRGQAEAAPGDVAKAVELADAYYRVSRREGDPRYLGYAQAALMRWWDDAAAPVPVLVTRATILQSAHEFPRALADLDRAIAGDPGNARAILVRATVHGVVGKYREAEADCGRLLGLTQDTYVIGCAAGVAAVTGNARQAAAALERTVAQRPDLEPETRAWFSSLLAEIAERQGDPVAERHFRQSLEADPSDLYTLAAYCDWLLAENRPADVVDLLRDQQRVDGLLLRLALAQTALGSPAAKDAITTLKARYAASHMRGDTVHRREEARFQLALAGDAKQSLRLARENWEVQREPADLRILAEAAKATGDAAASQTVRQWLTSTGLEYPAVAALVKAEGAK